MTRTSRLKLLATTCLLVESLVFVAAAAAQDRGGDRGASPADQAARSGAELIVVTGRRSVDTPEEVIKRNADPIVDSVTASDIETTGDLNLTDSLNRIAGVTAVPFYGTSESGYVAIRGFDPRYNSMDIDGNPIWFSSQNHRGAQSGQFPSILVNETSVYKTVTPEQDANSIGGHVSLRTLRAFDGGTEPYLRVGYRLGLPDQGSRVNGGPSNQAYGAGKFTFGPNNAFGIVLGFNRQRTADADDYGAIGGYVQARDANGVLRDVVSANIFADSAYDKTVRNQVFYGKLEARSEDKFYAFVSANILDEDRSMYLQRSGPTMASSATRVTPTGKGTATFTNAQGQIREYDYDMKRDGRIFGAGVDYRISEVSSISLRGGYTEYSNDILTRHLGSGFRILGMNGSYDLNGDVPTVSYSTADLYNDPANWSFNNTANTSGSAAYHRNQRLDDKVYNLSLVLHHNDQKTARGFGASAGAGWVRLNRRFDQNTEYWALRSGRTLALAQIIKPGATMAGNRAALIDYDAFWNYMFENGASRQDPAFTADYRLREDAISAHATLFYRTERLSLLGGLRYEHTKDVTDTGQVLAGANVPLHRRTSYDNFLPNFQATYDLGGGFQLKTAFTKTIGRPDFVDFAPGITTTIDIDGVENVRGSNPDLGPRISTNYDASIEYYFRNGYASATVFQKYVKGDTFTQIYNVFDGDGELVQVNRTPLNNGAARVTGIELSARKRKLDFLPAPFDRLGVSANFTWLDGRWDVVFEDSATRSVPGLRSQPKWQTNARLSYDAGPVDVYLNYAGQGRTFSGFGATVQDDVWIRPIHRLDAQISWALLDNRLRLAFDARNLTNGYITYESGIENSLDNSVGNGRSYWLGVSFRY